MFAPVAVLLLVATLLTRAEAQNVTSVEEPLALTPKLEEALQTGNLKPIEINPNLFLFLVNATSGEPIESFDAISGPQNILVANAVPFAGQNLPKLEPKVMELSLSTNSRQVPQTIVSGNLPFFPADSGVNTNASAELLANPFSSSPYQSNSETINSLIQNIFSNVTLEALPPSEVLFGALPEGNITEVSTIFDAAPVAQLDGENVTSRVIFAEETPKETQPQLPPQPIVTEEEQVGALQRGAVSETTGNINDQPVEETANGGDATLNDIGKWKPLTSEEAFKLSQQNVNVHANLVTPLTARAQQPQVVSVSSFQQRQTAQLPPAQELPSPQAQAQELPLPATPAQELPWPEVAPVQELPSPQAPAQELPLPEAPVQEISSPAPSVAQIQSPPPAPVLLHHHIRAQPMVPPKPSPQPAPAPLTPVDNSLQGEVLAPVEQSPPPSFISSNILDALRNSLPAGINVAEIPIYVVDNSQLGWREGEEAVFSNDGLQVNIPPQLINIASPQQVLTAQPAPVSPTSAPVVNNFPQVADILRLPKPVPVAAPAPVAPAPQPVTPLPAPAPRQHGTKSKAAFGSSALFKQTPMKEIIAKFQELMSRKKNEALSAATAGHSAPASSAAAVASSLSQVPSSSTPSPVVPVSANNRMNTNRRNVLATSSTSRQVRDPAPTSTKDTTDVNELFIESAADLVKIISLPNFKFYLGKRDN